jgi:hypothetical protein
MESRERTVRVFDRMENTQTDQVFDTPELAYAAAYELAKDYPNLTIHIVWGGYIAAAYTPRMGWH